MNDNMKKMNEFFLQYAIYGVLLVLIATIAIYNSNFLSVNTLRDILMQSSTRVIIALGAGFVLITAGVDLSAGRVVGLAAVLSSSMLQVADYSRRFFPDLPDLPIWVPILIAVIAGIIEKTRNPHNNIF